MTDNLIPASSPINVSSSSRQQNEFIDFLNDEFLHPQSATAEQLMLMDQATLNAVMAMGDTARASASVSAIVSLKRKCEDGSQDEDEDAGSPNGEKRSKGEAAKQKATREKARREKMNDR